MSGHNPAKYNLELMKGFASDNYAGVLPEVMEALIRSNEAHTTPYGGDMITERVTRRFRQLFGDHTEVLFVFNGTGANILSIASMSLSFQSVLCADTSHLYNDESTAPETITGCRFIPVAANTEGKLQPSALQPWVIRKGDVHYAQPGVMAITQSTEYGTVYTPDEIRKLSTFARSHNLLLHMDGARFFNAAASLGCDMRDISSEAGVDVLSLGGTKAGMMYGEAVLVFNPSLVKDIRFRQKQVMQLASKTRFIAAQFEALLHNECWLRTAQQANRMAALLREQLAVIPGVCITRPVDANAVFATIPGAWIPVLQQQYPFYVWKEAINEVRLMCSFDTTEAEVNSFAAAIQKLADSDIVR